MSLFIATGDESAGSGGSIFPDNATADLIAIANMDTGYGENPPASNLIQVTYARTDPGVCPTRLDALVNTDFGVNSAGIDIIILPVGGNFTLLDGTSMAGNGTSRSVGDSDNPTTSVLLIYDTSDDNGQGICLRKQGDPDGTYNLGDPSSVILYHELSHAFHEANNTGLSLAASGCAASPEENRAETDENDMRQQLGIALRDATDHCGNIGAGCSGSCCIVASVATGSVYSPEVNALREVRDGLLRRSDVGFAFFERLHADYYAFSPQVCTLMARSPVLLERIRREFVGPLAICLELIRAHAVERVSDSELGTRFLAKIDASPELGETSTDAILAGRELLGGRPTEPTDPYEQQLAALLATHAVPSIHVQWALLQPIDLLLAALIARRNHATAHELGAQLAAGIDAWATQLPLGEGWHALSRYDLREELRFLERTLVPNAATRRELGRRLAAHLHGEARALVEHRWGGAA